MIAEAAADFMYTTSEWFIADGTAIPHPIDDLIAGDNLPRRGSKANEYVHGLRLQVVRSLCTCHQPFDWPDFPIAQTKPLP
jgi:hypothetical protein